MKHYRIVKKSTHILIAISAFAVFFNAALFGIATIGLLKISEPTIASAESDASCSGTGDDVAIEILQGTDANFQINELFDVRVFAKDITKTYSFQLYIKDVKKDKSYTENTQTDINPAGGGGVTLSADTSSVGAKIVYAMYTQYKDENWCAIWAKTNEIPITIGDNTTSSTNITITVLDKTDQGSPVEIDYNITGTAGKKFALSVSKGDNCPNEPENANCWDTPVSLTNITSDPLIGLYSWPTTSQVAGLHAVNIKLYYENSDILTDKKIAFFTICEPGTAATTCVSASGDDDSGGETAGDGPIEVPKSIDKFSQFTSGFTMPKNVDTPGKLVQAIVDLLLYLMGAFAFIGIVVSGIQYISSGGDPAKAEKAKKNLMYCVIGIVIAVLALTIQGIVATFWNGPI